MMVQRWRISSNSQPHPPSRPSLYCCLWWFKDEEFQAIHNGLPLCNKTNRAVYDGSKMKNFKQFTTGVLGKLYPAVLFMMVQRWRISSNSQRVISIILSYMRCLWWFKDEEFQAIHNLIPMRFASSSAVYDGSKMKNSRL